MIGRAGPTLSILIYHRVLAQPDPLFPDQVDSVRFERHLQLLRRWFTVLPLLQAVHRLREGGLPPRAACITFDDGYADNHQLALPLLQKYGLSACFFISTGYLDGGRMWNDQIIDRVRHAPGPVLSLERYGLGRASVATLADRRAAIAYFLGQLKYLNQDLRRALAAEVHRGARYPEQQALMMTRAQVGALHQAGMEIGGHTVNHPILSARPASEALTEIASGKRQLETMLGAPVRLFAYPNGLPGKDYDERHVAMVRSLGFEAAVSTRWGAARHGSDLFQLPRFTPWDRSSLRFMVRMWQSMQMPFS